MQQSKDIEFKDDEFDNVLVVCTGVVEDSHLDAIVSYAQERRKNAVLIRCVGAQSARSIPHLLGKGAQYNGTLDDTVMLKLWIGQGESILPSGPSGPNATMGVVVCIRDSDTQKLLMVKERYGFWAGQWKYLTGTLERNEFPHECAAREIGEELGLEAKFVRAFGVLCSKWG